MTQPTAAATPISIKLRGGNWPGGSSLSPPLQYDPAAHTLAFQKAQEAFTGISGPTALKTVLDRAGIRSPASVFICPELAVEDMVQEGMAERVSNSIKTLANDLVTAGAA
jgi:hypothetical protein